MHRLVHSCRHQDWASPARERKGTRSTRPDLTGVEVGPRLVVKGTLESSIGLTWSCLVLDVFSMQNGVASSEVVIESHNNKHTQPPGS